MLVCKRIYLISATTRAQKLDLAEAITKEQFILLRELSSGDRVVGPARVSCNICNARDTFLLMRKTKFSSEHSRTFPKQYLALKKMRSRGKAWSNEWTDGWSQEHKWTMAQKLLHALTITAILLNIINNYTDLTLLLQAVCLFTFNYCLHELHKTGP
jgi:hypothetical protein